MIPNPYTALAGLLVAGGLLLGAYLYGRGDGREAQLEDDTKAIQSAQDAARKAGAALQAAAARLNADARLFREIDAQAQAEIEAAAALAQQAAQAAAEAKREQAAMAERIARLNRDAEKERSTCSHAEMRICGVPLH